MSSTVEVNMSVCSKKISVTASMREDGNIDIDVQSNCPNVRNYETRLKKVTIEDVTNFQTSIINNEEIRGGMSMICLAPIAVYQAAWMELGMMSKNIYDITGPCTIRKIEEGH